MNILRRAAVCATLLASSVFPASAAWTISNVEPGAGIGYAASLAIDTAGFPHISYYRPSTTMGFSQLAYATRTGSTWATETIVTGIMNGTNGTSTSIAVSDLGNPAVSFTRTGTFVRYTIRSGGSWMSPVDVSNSGGGFTSLVWQGTEAAPTPKIAYNDGATNMLKVASMAAGTFSSQTLDNAIAAGAYCSMAQVGSYMGVAFIDGSKLGFWQSPNDGMNWAAQPSTPFMPFSGTKAVVCALALAPTQHNIVDPFAISAHILYFDSTTSRYYYETNDTDTGVWATPELVYQSGLITNISSPGCSIVVDSAGVIHAAFLDYTDKRLGYASRSASGWSAATFVEGSDLGGAFCTIRMNAQQQPAIAYAALAFNSGSMTYEANGLRFAEFSNSTSGGSGSAAPSIAITGKAKRTTTKSTLLVKGTAAGAVSVQWRIGKKSYKRVSVKGGAWKAKVGPVPVGTTKVSFRAVSANGQNSSLKKITVKRGN